MPDICLQVFFPNTQFYLLTITTYAAVWCVSSSQRLISNRSLITSLLQVSKVGSATSYEMFYVATLRSICKFPSLCFFLRLACPGILGLYPLILYPFKYILRNHYTNGDATSYQ